MERLGKYEIISEIGRGAMGAVYKARDPLIGRLVALKTITSGLTAQANSLERFYQEARSAGALQHPNIVTIYELGHENNIPFIAMEFIEGGSLDHFMEQHQVLPLSVKLGYIVRVCEALSYAHRHNVVHRDIKPGNIMVTKDGVVKVVDFGIARLTDMSLTQPNMMIGSRAYMSPQLYKGERADSRADIWAVGVTLYELLANKRPFLGENEAELMFHIISDEPPGLRSLVDDCPEELALIVEKMLAKKADDRYQSMEEVLRDIEPLWKTAQQATVAGLLTDCQTLLAANDLQRAQALLRKALQIDVGNSQAKSLLEKVSSELRRSQLLPKLNEHLERGRNFLRDGKLDEARAEARAALGLDSRHEPAQRFVGELEEATARALEVEQKLRLTKQRLAEGALTEAATALGQALGLDAANAQGKELLRQIEEERIRREKRKKLSEILHHARTLWTALNYEECLAALSEALREFPGEPELLKLQEMARHDLEDLQKQRQLGEVRKLLGQQDFAKARKIIDVLAKTFPKDSAVINLQTLVLDGEKEQQRAIRYTRELSDLRSLLSNGKFGEAVTKGDALFREYPEEFELKELVGYARSELAQLEQRQKERDRESEIRKLISKDLFKEAEAAAKRATQEFPKLEVFRNLADEAGQKRLAQEQGERARLEMQRRIDEIRGMIKKGQISDAIDRAQQTIGKFGPDPNVTQLLQTASFKQAEHQKKTDQDRQFAVAQTLIDAGNFAGATQVLNQAMATQIFEQSDPRVQKQLRTIEQLSKSGRIQAAAAAKLSQTPAIPSRTPGGDGNSGTVLLPGTPALESGANFSATMVVRPQTKGGGTPPAVLPDRSAKTDRRPKESGPSASGTAPSASSSGGIASDARAQALFASGEGVAEQSAPPVAKRPLIPPELIALIQANVKKPVILGGVGAVLIVILIITAVAGRGKGAGEKEKNIRAQAMQLWTDHQFDQSEQAWRELERLRGSYAKEATTNISQIEENRQLEQRRFDEAQRLAKEKDFPRAAEEYKKVIAMDLWHTGDAQRELNGLPEQPATPDPRSPEVQEKEHFDSGEQYLKSKNYEQARKEFRAVLGLKAQNSTLRAPAEQYVAKITKILDEKGLFDGAMQDLRNEAWTGAHDKLQQLVDRKSPLASDARQKLGEIAEAQKTLEEFGRHLQAGAYRNAKVVVDGMPWPKTQSISRQKLQDTERRQFEGYESTWNTLKESHDADSAERLQDDVRKFANRAEDGALVQSANQLDKTLSQAALDWRRGSDQVAFDAAIAAFNKAKGDAKSLRDDVMPKFAKLAQSPGIYHDQAKTYVEKLIPAAIASLKGSPKLGVPPLNCSGSGPASTPADPSLSTVACAQLDADSPVQWADGSYQVDFPDSANQPGKLPYTLKIIVTVDASGKVKVDKDGNVDKDFLKKVKDASKNWKTTIPKSGGKPVSVKFPLSITFQR